MDEQNKTNSEKPINRFKFSNLFIPHRGYIVTPALIVINILIYLLMVVSGGDFWNFSPATLIHWGTNLGAAFAAGQYWRLLTSCFVHNGLLHLLLNMPELLFIGYVLEKRIGSGKFLFAYLLTGIVGSLFSISFHGNMLSSGASGSILGMYGVFFPLLLSPTFINKDKRRTLLVCVSVLAGSTLLGDLPVHSHYTDLMKEFVGETDNAAHWGGFLTGIVTGYFFLLQLKSSSPQYLFAKLQWIAPIIFAGIIFIIVNATTNHRKGSFEDTLIKEKLTVLENQAIQAYESYDDGTPDSQIAQAKAYNIYADSCIQLIQNYLSLPTTDSISQGEFNVLLEYFTLRYSFYEELIQYIESDYSLQYTFSLNQKENRISAILDYLNGKTPFIQEESSEPTSFP